MTLPHGWAEARLDDVAEVRLGRQRSPDKAQGDNLIPYLRAANIRWGGLDLTDVKIMQFSPDEVRTFQLRRDDILVVEASGSQGEVGKSALWKEELPLACLQNTLLRVRTRGVEPTFLQWRLHFDALMGRLGDASKGVGIYHIGAERLSNWQLEIPPINEQRRIVAKLDTIFEQTRAAKARLERLSAPLEKLKRSILAAAFRGNLTKNWRAAHPDVEPASALLERIRAERRRRWETGLRAKGKNPRTTTYFEPKPVEVDGLPDLPEGWAWASLEQVADIVDPNPSHRMPKYLDHGGYPFISTENFTDDDGVDLRIGKRIARETLLEQQARFEIHPGDFVLTRIGTIGLTRPLSLPQIYGISHALVVIQRLSTELSPNYLRLAASTDALLEQAHGGVQSVGVPDLGMAKIRAFAVPIAPSDEQEVLVHAVQEALKLVKGMTTHLERGLERVERLEQTALAKAFRGELVPQDPNDEPASVLLDRIRATRAAKTERPRGGRSQRGSDSVKAETMMASNGHATNGHHDDSLDLVVAIFQSKRRLTATAISKATGLGSSAVKTALKALIEGGQVRVNRAARGTTYVWST